MHASLGLQLKRMVAKQLDWPRPGVASFLKLYNGISCQTSLDGVIGRAIYTFACDRDSLPGSDQHLWTRNAMDSLLGAVAAVGHAIEQVLVYVESHHWIFGALAGGYIFYLHDRALHARFDALEKRID